MSVSDALCAAWVIRSSLLRVCTVRRRGRRRRVGGGKQGACKMAGSYRKVESFSTEILNVFPAPSLYHLSFLKPYSVVLIISLNFHPELTLFHCSTTGKLFLSYAVPVLTQQVYYRPWTSHQKHPLCCILYYVSLSTQLDTSSPQDWW